MYNFYKVLIPEAEATVQLKNNLPTIKLLCEVEKYMWKIMTQIERNAATAAGAICAMEMKSSIESEAYNHTRNLPDE